MAMLGLTSPVQLKELSLMTIDLGMAPALSTKA